MKGFTIELPGELLEILGSEDEARRDAKVAVVPELLDLTLWDLPAHQSILRRAGE